MNSREIEKNAAIYVGDDRMVFHSFDRSTGGPWVRNAFQKILPLDSGPHELWDTIGEALSISNSSDPANAKLGKLREDRLQGMSVKSDSEMLRKYRCLSVHQLQNRIELVPTRRKGGYIDIPDQRVSTPMDEADFYSAFVEGVRQCL